MTATFDQVANIIAETVRYPRDTRSRRKATRSTISASTVSISSISPSPSTRHFGIKLPLEKWTQEVNDGKATTEQYFVLKNLSARIDELVAAKGA